MKQYPFMGEGGGFLRELRMVPDEIDYTLSYWIYNNKIIYMSSLRETFAFIIESEEMVKTAQTQFDFIWTRSTKIKARNKDTDAFLKEVDGD